MDNREMIERALMQLADAKIDYDRAWNSMAILATMNQIGGEEHIFTREDITSVVKLGRDGIIDALAEQAIVIECEVEHKEFVELGLGRYTKISTIRSPYYGDITILHGHHGPPGKAIAIIMAEE